MKIFVTSNTVHTYFLIDLQGVELIQQLKLLIQEKEGFSIEDQSLIFKCKPLRNNLTLNDYGIKEGDLLTINHTIRGGMHQSSPLVKHDLPNIPQKNTNLKLEHLHLQTDDHDI